MNKAEIVFKEELDLIKSAYIKEFVLVCFENLTPDYFWEVGASSSGKHHPQIANREHGLIIHTKLCVWWGRKLSECFHRTELDVIIAACLLHDLQKFGQIMDDGKPTLANYTSTHGVMLAIQMEQLCKKLEKSYDHGFISVIIAAVALHMGIFTDASLGHKFNNEYGDNNNVKIVHLADMVASRKTEDLYDGLAKWEYPKELV